MLPLWQREWFIKRLNKEITKSDDGKKNQSRAAHENMPTLRNMLGRDRPDSPARLRRFT